MLCACLCVLYRTHQFLGKFCFYFLHLSHGIREGKWIGGGGGGWGLKKENEEGKEGGRGKKGEKKN